MLEDQSLVERAQRGDKNAFAQLVEAYQTPVYNLAYRMLGNANDAEDAAQETFLRAYAQLRHVHADQKFATWLLSIDAHYCIDRLRRRRFLWLSLEDTALNETLASDAPEPGDELLRRESQQETERLLVRLSPASRLVVVLRYWHAQSIEEIAKTTGDSVSAVKVRLFRARQSLAREMAVNSVTPALAGGARVTSDPGTCVPARASERSNLLISQ
jgi:RNA polymerase sigma-70 factor (ECF subfamily)